VLDLDSDRRPELVIGAHGVPGPLGGVYRRATLAILPGARRRADAHRRARPPRAAARPVPTP
jgi:hypothetical protein